MADHIISDHIISEVTGKQINKIIISVHIISDVTAKQKKKKIMLVMSKDLAFGCKWYYQFLCVWLK